MTSFIPVLSERWRSTPDEYVAVLAEAQDLAPQPSVGGEVISPSWMFETKKKRLDRPTGSVDEVAPEVLIPARYAYASVSFGDPSGESILVRLARWGIRIEIRGSDKKWLKGAERWAREAVRAHRPWWWRLASVPGLLLGIPLSIALPFLGWAIGGQLGLDTSVSVIVGSVIGFSYTTSSLLLSVQPRVLISDGGRTKSVTFAIQAALMAVSGVVGWIIGRVGDAVLPPPAP